MSERIHDYYILQYDDMTIKQATAIVEAELSMTERTVKKIVYKEHDLTVEYLIPVFDSLIRIYPISDEFVDRFAPSEFTQIALNEDEQLIVSNMNRNTNRGSFLMRMPEELSSKQNEYLVKFLGICLGGYYSNIVNVPRDGVLNRVDHFYITASRSFDDDILDDIENILVKHIKEWHSLDV